MHQNEKKIDYELIALQALNGIIYNYKDNHNKDTLCDNLRRLLNFASVHNALGKTLISTLDMVIEKENLISWQKERQTRE